MSGARYVILEQDFLGKRVVIRDVGPWDKHRTVTNDAEEVVRFLLATDVLAADGRLFYIDSEGEPGELLVRDGRFAEIVSWDGGAA
jgi:hypothetical protein